MATRETAATETMTAEEVVIWVIAEGVAIRAVTEGVAIHEIPEEAVPLAMSLAGERTWARANTLLE